MSQQYTGRENDGTGLMYYRARYYHAGCARFISEDPIGWASGQTNNYAYVGGDPVSYTDPSVLLSWDTNANVQAQISVMVGVVGGSLGVGQNISTDGKSCTYVQICPRIGGGVYVGGGIGAGGGIGGTASSPGVSAGVGADLGAGAVIGGQITAGPDGIAVSGGKLGLGIGYGISVGVDFRLQIPISCKQVFGPNIGTALK